MKNEDIPDKVIDGDTYQDITAQGEAARPPEPASDALGQTFSQRLQVITDAIEDINRQVSSRKRLSAAFAEEIDARVKHLGFLLGELDRWTLGHNPAIESRRLWLQGQILALERERRSEQLRIWADVVSLMAKRREFIMEYESLRNIRRIL